MKSIILATILAILAPATGASEDSIQLIIGKATTKEVRIGLSVDEKGKLRSVGSTQVQPLTDEALSKWFSKKDPEKEIRLYLQVESSKLPVATLKTVLDRLKKACPENATLRIDLIIVKDD